MIHPHRSIHRNQQRQEAKMMKNDTLLAIASLSKYTLSLLYDSVQNSPCWYDARYTKITSRRPCRHSQERQHQGRHEQISSSLIQSYPSRSTKCRAQRFPNHVKPNLYSSVRTHRSSLERLLDAPDRALQESLYGRERRFLTRCCWFVNKKNSTIDQ
jgi:hypothetical protein